MYKWLYNISIETWLGCPALDSIGEDCPSPCPDNYLQGQCDDIHGTCVTCLDGYGGQRCDQS